MNRKDVINNGYMLLYTKKKKQFQKPPTRKSTTPYQSSRILPELEDARTHKPEHSDHRFAIARRKPEASPEIGENDRNSRPLSSRITASVRSVSQFYSCVILQGIANATTVNRYEEKIGHRMGLS
ncbi:hypothetical protein HanXRQr2_Chr03g0092931 [Helianthus annuus]|uniref:Uncharacterized protein n=1 Tax=Helianthus annuus TaxID=4232 RepID=A0A9K3JCK4_HELAN|nr:hypothetical protein HanXRQr2_Chr03g0092931 [Helianthus annuus]